MSLLNIPRYWRSQLRALRYRLQVKNDYQLGRLWSNQELEGLAPIFSGNVVNVSAWKDEDKMGRHYSDYFSSATSYSITNYGGVSGESDRPDEIQLDLESPLPDEMKGQFDVVLNHTTLEHVFDVFTAFENLCSLSSDIVIVVVPFLQQQHTTKSFGDYWRFTPLCLERLFKREEMKVIYSSSSQLGVGPLYFLAIGSRQPDIWASKIPPSPSLNLGHAHFRPPWWLRLFGRR